MKTKITELLGIKYPIIQGGMAWTSDANLAAAVSNAGRWYYCYRWPHCRVDPR